MLINARTLMTCTLNSREGRIGPVSDLYFDDDWTIRYLSAHTRHWISGKTIMVPAASLAGSIDAKKCIEAGLTNSQIDEGSSSTRLRLMVARKRRRASRPDCRPVPFYRGGILCWRTPTSRESAHEESSSPPGEMRRGDEMNLRGIREVTGYRLHAADGRIGDIADFIIDEETWKIRFLIIEPLYWWLGSRIAVTPDWARQVSWSAGRLTLALPHKTVQAPPPPRGGLACHS